MDEYGWFGGDDNSYIADEYAQYEMYEYEHYEAGMLNDEAVNTMDTTLDQADSFDQVLTG